MEVITTYLLKCIGTGPLTDQKLIEENKQLFVLWSNLTVICNSEAFETAGNKEAHLWICQLVSLSSTVVYSIILNINRRFTGLIFVWWSFTWLSFDNSSIVWQTFSQYVRGIGWGIRFPFNILNFSSFHEYL